MPTKSPIEGHNKSTFIYGNDAKVKNSFIWEIPLPATPKGCEKGAFFMGMTPTLKTNLFLEYIMTNANHFNKI